MSNEEIEEIKVKEKKSEDYELIPCTDAKGGIEINNMFKMDLLTTQTEEEGDEYVQIDKEGNIVGSRSEKEVSLVRERRVGVLMNTDRAFIIACWILANLFGEDDKKIQDFMLEKFGGEDNVSKTVEEK